MTRRSTFNPAAVAAARFARTFAAYCLELRTPTGNAAADHLQLLARAIDPPKRTGRPRRPPEPTDHDLWKLRQEANRAWRLED